MFGKVRNFHNATLFSTSAKRKRNTVDNEVEISVDKSVDRTDPGEDVFNPANRDLEHHHEKNTRELPRLSLELMSSAVSYEIAARLANAALMDYEAIKEEDTSQLVTISKLYYESCKVGKKLNTGAIIKFKAKPPAFMGFDGKIMDVNSQNVDERGVNHPVQNKVDEIGNLV